jgi:hypothetical protein
MDFREAKACLDEYRISLDATCGMLNFNAAEGELRDAIIELNDSLIARLGVQEKEAIVLSILIMREMVRRNKWMPDFLEKGAHLSSALNELKVATDKASQVRADYFRKIAANNAKEAAKSAPNPIALAIEQFRRKNGLKSQEREEYDRNMGLKTAT